MVVCAKCQEQIKEEATTCPHCGYAPGEDLKERGNKLLGWGFLATVTVIGAIVGIPMILGGLWNRRKAKSMTPADA